MSWQWLLAVWGAWVWGPGGRAGGQQHGCRSPQRSELKAHLCLMPHPRALPAPPQPPNPPTLRSSRLGSKVTLSKELDGTVIALAPLDAWKSV